MTTIPLWLVAALALGVPLTAPERAQVLAGDVLVTTTGDQHGARAAIRIAAPPARVFSVMTSCAQALRYVPRLESCRVIEAAADGSHARVEHVVKPRWYLPRIRFVFRADYRPPHEVRITNVSGGLREHEARWTLEPLDGGRATLVDYQVRIVPRYPVPEWLVLATLKRDLPAMMRGLAARCEQPAR